MPQDPQQTKNNSRNITSLALGVTCVAIAFATGGIGLPVFGYMGYKYLSNAKKGFFPDDDRDNNTGKAADKKNKPTSFLGKAKSFLGKVRDGVLNTTEVVFTSAVGFAFGTVGLMGETIHAGALKAMGKPSYVPDFAKPFKYAATLSSPAFEGLTGSSKLSTSPTPSVGAQASTTQGGAKGADAKGASRTDAPPVGAPSSTTQGGGKGADAKGASRTDAPSVAPSSTTQGVEAKARSAKEMLQKKQSSLKDYFPPASNPSKPVEKGSSR